MHYPNPMTFQRQSPQCLYLMIWDRANKQKKLLHVLVPMLQTSVRYRLTWTGTCLSQTLNPSHTAARSPVCDGIGCRNNMVVASSQYFSVPIFPALSMICLAESAWGEIISYIQQLSLLKTELNELLNLDSPCIVYSCLQWGSVSARLNISRDIEQNSIGINWLHFSKTCVLLRLCNVSK